MTTTPTTVPVAALAAERRQAPRYPLDLPVVLGAGQGRSHDYSASGVLVQTSEPPAPGALVRVSLLLGQPVADESLRLDCEGRVVRVTPHDGHVDVAVAFSACD